MKKQLYPVLVSALGLASCEQEQQKVFALEGEFSGQHTEYLLLHYTDSLNNYVEDTIRIDGDKFYVETALSSPQKVSLTSNLTGEEMEDPNRLLFFLEPEKVRIDLAEGQFSQAKISGSKTQLESENLSETLEPYYEEQKKQYGQLLELRSAALNSEQDPQQLESVMDSLKKTGKKIDEIKIAYAFANKDSYLSADIINSYLKRMSRDSLELFYSNAAPSIKESKYGMRIKDQIALHVVSSGDKAPGFSGKDQNGEELSLEQFKGSHVILDFTAGWCIPCIENHPRLKSIYNAYEPEGLEIISISLDKDQESWKNFIEKEQLDWHHLYQGFDNLGGKGEITTLYTVQPIPAYILIDKEGNIVNRYAAADNHKKTIDDLEKDLKEIFSAS